MGGTFELPFGLGTAVGPLPGDDPAASVRMALSAQPEFPCSPTSGSAERSLLAQAVAGVAGVEVAPSGVLQVGPAMLDPDPSGCWDGALSLDGASHEAFHLFLSELSPRPSIGVRVGVLGPVTLALALRAGGVRADRAVVLAGALVARRAAAVLGAVRAALPEGVVMVCASEPGLVGAMHPTFPLAPAQVLGVLTPFVDALDQHPLAGDLLIGVHVPGRTDWATVIASGVSVVSAPVGPELATWAPTLSDFLARGGRMVWGAVPVDQPLGTSEELLWRRLSAMWCEMVAGGMDPLPLRSRSLVGPVDGLAHFGPSQAERVLHLVDSLSTRVRRQAIGARLTLGA